MTEGELLQLTLIGRTDISSAQYFTVLQRKTAFLFSACCEIGAILAGVDEAGRAGLREYGLQLGTAFQLVDDLLDCTSTGKELGKAAGADLLEGKLTLPLIFLLGKEERWREVLQTIMWDGAYSGNSRDNLLEAVVKSGAKAYAQERAEECAGAARLALAALPDSTYKEALAELPAYILGRQF